ncbi:MAG TPA: hypothetical protein VNK50_04645 [Calidithermus sp.]|nr:hypothetical protein [Calidithermus sp.]
MRTGTERWIAALAAAVAVALGGCSGSMGGDGMTKKDGMTMKEDGTMKKDDAMMEKTR